MTLAVMLGVLAIAAGLVVLLVLFLLSLWSVFEREPQAEIVPVNWYPAAPATTHWLEEDPPNFDWPERS